MATDADLDAIVKGCHGDFRPYHEINEASDSLTVYFRPDPDYSKRLTEHVTLYLSLETDEIVGCRIKGIKGILEDLPNEIRVRHKSGNLWLIFWAFRGCSDEDVRSVMRKLETAAIDNEMTVSTV